MFTKSKSLGLPNEAQLFAFNAIKESLCSKSLLMHHDCSLPLFLYVDSSVEGGFAVAVHQVSKHIMAKEKLSNEDILNGGYTKNSDGQYYPSPNNSTSMKSTIGQRKWRFLASYCPYKNPSSRGTLLHCEGFGSQGCRRYSYIQDIEDHFLRPNEPPLDTRKPMYITIPDGQSCLPLRPR